MGEVVNMKDEVKGPSKRERIVKATFTINDLVIRRIRQTPGAPLSYWLKFNDYDLLVNEAAADSIAHFLSGGDFDNGKEDDGRPARTEGEDQSQDRG